jgi:hypothetical protein
MNRIIKSASFKYFKNFVIGIGASIVMIGALGKIRSYPWGDAMITVGLLTEGFPLPYVRSYTTRKGLLLGKIISRIRALQ